MKQIAGILVSSLLLLPLAADASISTKANSSNTSTYVSQITNTGPWSSIRVQYTNDKTLPILTLTKTDSRDYLFSDRTQLVTDGVASDLKLMATYRNPTGFRTQTSSLGRYEFTPTQIASIQNAKNVSLQVSFRNTSTITWKVSEKVLNEWKEILARGQSQVSLQKTPISIDNHSPITGNQP
ncbi:hypothetical protein [Sporomusa acidovorans]|uniref:hypothetical protein n=1 Tax=Sporomusa acidovorans TaxID=112900 RepID=UPI0008831E99|nr:hypothetical protein [Sporomusa acidovorans]OZC19116.1 hypothetical protein SPACI_32020 [Sporomusa acidovorans DSM 3132]SDD67766.1 hypothetical protein SAMN04488499_100362 [Sporomusa acidovorans]